MAKPKNYKKIALYVFYSALTIAILVTILSFNDIDEIFEVMGTADIKYILVAFAFLLAYALIYPLTTCILARAQKLNTPFMTTYTIAMTEHFFNGITPFATGGQPFQVYAFKKAGVKISDSTGLLMMNFIIFMISTNTFAMLSLIYAKKFVTTVPMMALAIVGFTLNFGVLAFIIALATSKRLRHGLSSLVLLLCKIKFLKKFLEPRVAQLNEYFEQVQAAFKALFKKVGVFILCLLLKMIAMAFYYAVTFYILRALHIDVGYDQMFFIICGTSFAITMVVFMPTPGSSGGIEFAFESVFANLAVGSMIASVSYGGMLIWRLLSYYFMMGLSLVFYIALEIYFSVKARRAAPLAQHMEAPPAENGEEAPAPPEEFTEGSEQGEDKE